MGRTEDPVRLYLREMGKVSLLTREGEITLAKRIEEGKDEATGATLSTTLAIDKIRLLRDKLRHDVIPIKDVVDYNEEESTEEKEAELRRSVIRELGNVDRLLREREKLQQQVRQIKAKNGTRKKDKAEPPWKKFDGQAQGKSVRVLTTLRGLHLQPSLLDEWGQDLKKLVEKIQRAEREIALWSDGRRPAPTAVDAFLSSLSDGDDDGDRDLYQTRRVEAPLDQGPAGVGRAAEDQARRGAAPTRAPMSSRPSSPSSRRARPRPRAPRRRWSRPTCASSSRSPRSTRTGACSSST